MRIALTGGIACGNCARHCPVGAIMMVPSDPQDDTSPMVPAVNIAMCIRMSPVTGLPLPLVSYGGTFLVITMTYLGIVHSVYGHRERNSIFDL